MIFPLKPSFSSGIFQQAMFDYQYRRVYLSGTMDLRSSTSHASAPFAVSAGSSRSSGPRSRLAGSPQQMLGSWRCFGDEVWEMNQEITLW